VAHPFHRLAESRAIRQALRRALFCHSFKHSARSS
jgi:hypothetical protein